MEFFRVLDILTRGILVPLGFVFIFKQMPELKKDIKEMFSLFAGERKVHKKRKTIQVHTGGAVNSNSFSSYSKVSDNYILSHE